ncbi:MAG: hypothetical protein AAGM22_23505 [Acidobacteriota bacterium]
MKNPLRPFASQLPSRALLGVTALSLVLLASAIPAAASTALDRVADIEAAHAAGTYGQQSAVKADFTVDFGPMLLEGTMWFTPSMGHVRLELEGGQTIVYDGATAWLSPADAEVPGPPARFHVLTWPYFVAVPYKLDDPGTHHKVTGPHPVRSADEKLHGTKVTFDAGVGDTPEDWYIAFADEENGRLSALAYIVTYGTALEEASKTPSIVLYDDFVDVDGVPFATTWTFHFWQPESGVEGDPKGTAKLSNIAFVNAPKNAFVKPAGAVEAAAPGQ